MVSSFAPSTFIPLSYYECDSFPHLPHHADPTDA